MISKTIGFRCTQHFQTNPVQSPCRFLAVCMENHRSQFLNFSDLVDQLSTFRGKIFTNPSSWPWQLLRYKRPWQASRSAARIANKGSTMPKWKAAKSPSKRGKYPLVMTNSLLWKNPPFFMGKSTISLAMFHSYVSLPEGKPTIQWWCFMGIFHGN